MEFQQWLDQNTNLLERSKKQYLKVINLFLKNYHDLNIENINHFLSDRKIRVYKFAFRYYLEFMGSEIDFKDILKMRTNLKKKFGTYTDKQTMEKIILLINDNRYRVVALIQYLTGSRSFEILGLKRDNIEIKPDQITLHLIAKGGFERTVAIPFPEAKLIVDFIAENKRDYPFMKGKADDLVKMVNNNYRYYYQDLREASIKAGVPKFRPHDFRRNLASDVYKGSKDIFLVQQLLGHKSIQHTAVYLQQIRSEEASKKAIEDFRR